MTARMVRLKELAREETDSGEDGTGARAAATAARRARARGRNGGAIAIAKIDFDGVNARAYGGAQRETKETTLAAALLEKTSVETRDDVNASRSSDGRASAVGRDVGVRTIDMTSDGTMFIGGDDGIARRVAIGGETTERFYPDLWRDSEFVNGGQLPVRAVCISQKGDEALVGYDNGGWVKVSLKSGLTVASSMPHDDFADVFKFVESKKVSKYANTAPQCRALVTNDDLSVIYLASPCLRDGRVYAWDLRESAEVDEQETTLEICQEKEFNNASTPLMSGKLDDMDGIDVYDAWMNCVAAGQESSQTAPKRIVGTVKHLEFHTDCVTSLVRVNSALISGSNDSHIAVWDLKSKAKSPKPYSMMRMTSAVSVMTTSKDGRTLYGAGADGSVRVYDLKGKSGKLTLHWVRSIGGQDGRVTSLCAVRNDPFIIVGSSKVSNPDLVSVIRGEGDLCMWRVTDGTLMFRSAEHDADVTALAVSADGTTFCSGDAKGNICKHVLSSEPVERQDAKAPIRKGFLL